jgi:hypothetical protein
MPTSDKQIEANRRNARKSTGPVTPEGKAAVRHNALKHGLLAREAVIAGGAFAESEQDFETFLAGLHDDLDPQGSLEELLVEQIGICYWRLRRALRADTREFEYALSRHLDRPPGINLKGEPVNPRPEWMPHPQTLDTFTRYEKTIHNQLQRALDNLARLQSRRAAGPPTDS